MNINTLEHYTAISTSGVRNSSGTSVAAQGAGWRTEVRTTRLACGQVPDNPSHPTKQIKSTDDCICSNDVIVVSLLPFQDEYNLNPGLEWEDEFTGRYDRQACFQPVGHLLPI